MTFSLFEETVTGLDIGHAWLKIVQAKKSSRGTRLSRAAVVPVPPASAQPRVFAEFLDSVFRSAKIHPSNIVLAIGAPGVEVHRLELPRMAGRERGEAVRWNMQNLLGFPLDRAALDYRTLPALSGEESVELESVLVVAADNDLLGAELDMLGRLELEPVGAQAACLAGLESYLRTARSGARETVALLDIGHEGTGVTLVTQGQPRLHRYLPFGGAQLTRYLSEALHADPEEAEKQKLALTSGEPLVEPLDQLGTRIERVFQHFEDVHPTEKVDRILMYGGTALLPGIERLLTEQLHETVERLNPLSGPPLDSAYPDVETVRRLGPALVVACGLVS
ncbi:MAG: pilus assembly protein PilM [Candidatus Wallbacteria bacterium]|nr:pilus assembly protein PilM [Candidatus Wallbacteria bacterium]MBI4868610.1 pilus assembly protein PilM [Candidatus Wallbacteria bacterium]